MAKRKRKTLDIEKLCMTSSTDLKWGNNFWGLGTGWNYKENRMSITILKKHTVLENTKIQSIFILLKR